jgi:uncharacterized repeat protein (TIGR04052 family)
MGCDILSRCALARQTAARQLIAVSLPEICATFAAEVLMRLIMSVALSVCVAFAAGCDGGGTGSGGTGGQGASAGQGGTGGTGAQGGTAGQGGTGAQGGSAGTGSGPIAVSIAFEGRVGAEVFDCTKTYTGLGSSAAEVRLSDFRLYVHDVALRAKDGSFVPVMLDQDGLWQYQSLALLDFESGTASCANGTAELNNKIMGMAPAGEYDGISFKLGVPFDLNHEDAAVAPSPLNLTALFWNWNGGYKFFRADGLATGAPMAFNLHLGSTDCQSDGSGGIGSCGRPNRADIVLTGFDPLKKTILVDYAAVVAESDLTKNAGDAPGCMSGAIDPECGIIFDHLGLDVVTGMPKDGQTLFRVE